MSKKESKNFEEQLKRLEEIVNLLDEDTISLEDSLKLYEEGTELSKTLKTFLEKAEQKIIDINKKSEQISSSSDE